jgi:uncharacterized protein YndB with AHSA1/START domain
MRCRLAGRSTSAGGGASQQFVATAVSDIRGVIPEGDDMPTASITVSQQIARGAGELFDAFVDPTKITRFWLEKVSGPLEAGSKVRWWFMVPGATETVSVIEVLHNQRIVFDWSDGIRVCIEFEKGNGHMTLVSVRATGFPQEPSLEKIVDATEGFSIVLCDLKVFAETGRSPNLVRDKAKLIASLK